MSNYTKLLNNLDTLKLLKIRENLDTYQTALNHIETNYKKTLENAQSYSYSIIMRRDSLILKYFLNKYFNNI